MSVCLPFKSCLRRYVHWPGIFEAGLHCLYTGFFVIEAATYGLILEQKFHGVLQIVLINFYLVLLCLVFIRWNMDINSSVCHLLISILSFFLTLFVGKLILLYIEFMEKPRHSTTLQEHSFPTDLYNNSTGYHHKQSMDPNDEGQEDDNFPKKILVDRIMKLDPMIVILDISVYLLISISYIVMLLKISFKLRQNSKILLSGITRGVPSTIHRSPSSFYEINSSESSMMSVA